MAKKKQTSEFGKGFIYNIFLFAKHWERLYKFIQDYKSIGFPIEHAYGLWFNGAGDHFYEFVLPSHWANKKVGKLALKLQTQAIHFRLHNCSTQQLNKFMADMHTLVMLIDKELGVKAIEARYT